MGLTANVDQPFQRINTIIKNIEVPYQTFVDKEIIVNKQIDVPFD